MESLSYRKYSCHISRFTLGILPWMFTDSLGANCRDIKWAALQGHCSASTLSRLSQLFWMISLNSIKRIDRSRICAYFGCAFPPHNSAPISCFLFLIHCLASKTTDLKTSFVDAPLHMWSASHCDVRISFLRWCLPGIAIHHLCSVLSPSIRYFKRVCLYLVMHSYTEQIHCLLHYFDAGDSLLFLNTRYINPFTVLLLMLSNDCDLTETLSLTHVPHLALTSSDLFSY